MPRYDIVLLTDPSFVTRPLSCGVSISACVDSDGCRFLQVVTKLAPSDASFQPPEEPELPVIDMGTFEQILELDEDDSREFSADMVWQYFDQANVTFKDMDAALYVTDFLFVPDAQKGTR